jgi:hypothetical protein
MNHVNKKKKKILERFKFDAMLERTCESYAGKDAEKRGIVSFMDDIPIEEACYPSITKIVVPTQYDKEQLLIALQYLHNCYINTDYLAVNNLVHLYQNPELIEVTKC